MNIACILHQQVMQLRYHFLACVTLIMVLPVQEFILAMREGGGLYAGAVSMPTLFLAPFLTALIACATVQADLDLKRCLFWQSKPVSVPAFMTLKYFVGLAMAMLVLGCPVGFMCLRDYLSLGHLPKQLVTGIFLIIALISLLTYSTCFFCNVLVRKTARAWLIGLAVACFVLLIPFLIPLPPRGVEKWMFGIYLVIGLGTTVLAFGLALSAVQYHWHLQTNLRGLLWAGAGLIFMLAVLFGRQVANIKILDEVPLPNYVQRISVREPGRYGLGVSGINFHEITIADARISATDLYREQAAGRQMGPGAGGTPLRVMPPRDKVDEDLSVTQYPRSGPITYRGGEQEYSIALHIYFRRENVLNKNGREIEHRRYKKLLLSSFEQAGSHQGPISTIDLSDCIVEDRDPRPRMRRLGDKLLVFTNNKCLVVGIEDAGALELLEKNRFLPLARFDRRKPFTVPLVPAAEVDIRERVRLSLDLVARSGSYYWDRHQFHNASLVSDYDGRMLFAKVSRDGVSRYDVLGWDAEKIHCQFRDTRAFLFGRFHSHDPHFLQDGKLYLYTRNTLMVLDMLADRGIRKLGHLQRFSNSFHIEDLAVEENGNILLLSSQARNPYPPKSTLYLLKSP